MKNIKLEEKRELQISSKEEFKGRMLHLYVDKVKLHDNSIQERELIRGCHAAAVLAINDKNEILIEEQYRYPFDSLILEIPAGRGEENENSQTTALRELEEETGYKAQNVEFLGSYYPTVGYSDENIHIYLAKDLIKAKRHLDIGEDIDYKFIPFEEFCNLIKEGKVNDGKTLAAIAYYLIKYQK